MTVDIRVRRALFVPPEKWASVAGKFSKTFKRRLRVLVVGELCECRGIPVRRPLPFGRTPDVYRVKSAGMEGDRLVVSLA